MAPFLAHRLYFYRKALCFRFVCPSVRAFVHLYMPGCRPACRRFLVTSYCDECVCLSVFPFACLENYMSRLNQIFCAFYLWTWLGPSFDTLFSRATWVSRYQKGKTSLDLNKARDDGVWDGSGISWTTCKQSAPRSGQISLKANSYRTK